MEPMLHIAPCGYFTFEVSGRLIEANNCFCELTGANAGTVSSQPLENFLTLPSKIFYQTHFFPLLKMQGHAEEIFLTLKGADGNPLPVLLNAVTHHHEKQAVFACAFIVVAHRKQFEDELVAARNKAEEALRENSVLQELRAQLLAQTDTLDQQLQRVRQQNTELAQFTRAVTHELQEPIRKISIFSQLLTEESADAMNREGTLERLSRSTKQMREVIASLQEYLWLQEAKPVPKPVELSAILQQTAERLATEYGERLLNLEIGNLPAFPADPEQFTILCYQLLSNSIKFRKEGGQVTVTVSATAVRKNRYKVVTDSYAYEPHLKISFADNGKGFDRKYRDRVLNLFERLQTNNGRGIGLALCKKIVENHGGTIELDAQENAGTIVTITVPHNIPAKKFVFPS